MGTPATGLSANAQGVIGGLSGGLLNGLISMFGPPSPQKVTTDSTSNSTSTPTYSSAVLPLYNQLLSSYMQRANGGAADAAINAYQSNGQQQINQTNAGGVNGLRSILAQRGQAFSPAGSSALIQQELARQAQQVGLNTSIPQMRYQMNTQDLNNSGNFFSSLPHGQTTSGSSNSTQTTQLPQQSGLAGILGGVAQALPFALKMF